MWALERPTHSARSTFLTCISRVRNSGLAARLTAATPTIVAASEQFDRAVRRTRLHEIASHDTVDPDVTVGEMEKVYTQRMAKIGAPGRDIYDEIFACSPVGRCPLCMPKAHFPSLAVAPFNLVPACSDCNKAKLNAIPTAAEQVPLHPYYDDLGDEIWLSAVVIERAPSALRFLVTRPAGWSDTLSARVDNHFRSFGLAALFASEAAEELVNIRHQLSALREADPENGIRDELERRAASCAVARVNGWRTAAYRAWCESDWFCDRGFLPAR